ncbi:MAG: redox-sensing transcriptional repressor Rex [Lachnospiraceae bacterium]|jgi:redox-sensing transcriptional repressor
MAQKTISRAVIKRLPRYYRYLGELMQDGVERISSRDLSDRMNITASQIRQDLNNFGGFGQQGYGYNVRHLYIEIGKILGLDRTYSVIIIGAGHLGQALANYGNFERRGFVFKAMFDIRPELEGQILSNIPVYSVGMLETYLSKNHTDIAALTLPKSAAQEMTTRLVRGGVRGIWNFAHVDLDVPEGTVVENVHLSESLMRISYRLNNPDGEEQS